MPTSIPPDAPVPQAEPIRPHSASATWPRPSSSLALTLKTVPSPARPSVLAWLQWWHETARIPMDILDVGVAEAKLSWWMTTLEEARQGLVQHPILQQLLDSPPEQDGLPPWPWWQGQLEALLHYIHQNRWMDEASLAQHIDATTGQAARCVAWLLGARDDAALDAARQWGCAIRRHHMLCRLGQDARAGWVHVPVDVLQRFDVKAHQLVKPNQDQIPNGWPALLSHLHDQAQQSSSLALQATLALPADSRLALRPLAILGAIQAAQGAATARAGTTVLFERITLTPWRRSWVAQRTAWRLWRGT